MSELAFNMNGEAFEVPAPAVGWRVRRMKLKGAPEVVYGRDGVPLVLPLEADIEDVRREVGGTPGRYRLDPVDENHRPLHDVPAGYVYVHADPRPSELANKPTPAPATTEGVVIEAMRMNAELARSVIDRFPMMMEAAAVLLRAADGAGLPARPGMAGEGAEDDDESASTTGFDLNGLVAQFAPILMMGLAGGKSKLPSVSQMLDWRKATPKTKAVVVDPETTDKGEPDAESAGVEPMVPPLDPATMAHFVAVQSMLAPEESALAREVAKELTPTELRAWFEELSELSVPDAVAKVRKLISGFGKAGGAS